VAAVPLVIIHGRGRSAMAKVVTARAVKVVLAVTAAMAAMEEEGTEAAMAATESGAPSANSAGTGGTRQETVVTSASATRRLPPLMSRPNGSWIPGRRTISQVI